jgi:hypothetical protein
VGAGDVDGTRVYESGETAGGRNRAQTGAPGARPDPDLAAVVEAWPTLPGAVKAGFNNNSHWLWGLPDEGAQADDLPKMLKCAPSRADGHLQATAGVETDSAIHKNGESGMAGNDGNGTPSGWAPAGWRDRLLQLADRCAETNPDRAAELRRQAAALDATTDRDLKSV